MTEEETAIELAALRAYIKDLKKAVAEGERAVACIAKLSIAGGVIPEELMAQVEDDDDSPLS
jgi:hypothetical protein|tara:strand:+ start:72 stop:257 length:186 start_codon:yes stop_codon:yes gene_type:complete